MNPLANDNLNTLILKRSQLERNAAMVADQLQAINAKIAQTRDELNAALVRAIDSPAQPTIAQVLAACAKDGRLLDDAVMQYLTAFAHKDLNSMLILACEAGFSDSVSDCVSFDDTSDVLPILGNHMTSIFAHVQLDGRNFVITNGMSGAFVLPRKIGDMIASISDNVFAAPFSILVGRRDEKHVEPNVEYIECICAIQTAMLKEIAEFESLPSASQHHNAPGLAILTACESLTRYGTGFARPELPSDDSFDMTFSHMIHVRVLDHTAGKFDMRPITLVRLAHGDQHRWYTPVYTQSKLSHIELSTRFVKTLVVRAREQRAFCVVEPYTGLPF